MTKCWDEIPKNDLTLFVVDAVKRLDFNVKRAVYRLAGIKVNSAQEIVKNQMAIDPGFDIDKFKEQNQHLFTEEVQLVPIHKVLVMNKIDLVSNRRRFK